MESYEIGEGEAGGGGVDSASENMQMALADVIKLGTLSWETTEGLDGPLASQEKERSKLEKTR